MQKQIKQSKQNNNIEFNTLRNYTTLYHTYVLLYCKGHIQITSNHSNINVKTDKIKVNKMTILNSIHLEIIPHYMTLTDYYIVKDAFSSQVITAM